MHAAIKKVPALFPAFLMLTGCPGPVPPQVNVPVALTPADKLLADLAKHVGDRFGSSGDFQVVVTGSAYPVGTLIRAGTSIPVDYSACAAAAPPKVSAPNIFPNYALSNKDAFSFGLDSAAVAQIASAGIDIGRTDTVNLAFKNTQSEFLSDNDIKKLVQSANCRAALSGEAVWLIRGYIEGQRTFSLKRDSNNSVNLGVTKVGTFKVDLGTGNASVGFTDDSSVQFLQVVSQISVPSSTSAQLAVTKPSALLSSSVGRVYIQRDVADDAAKGAAIVASLKSGGLGVISTVQAIPSAKMPNLAQVRYFNDGDLDVAQKALDTLKLTYPNAVLRKVNLPSPTGQLEVWLPKVGT